MKMSMMMTMVMMIMVMMVMMLTMMLVMMDIECMCSDAHLTLIHGKVKSSLKD